MAADRLEWVGERLVELRSPAQPQPAPIRPTLAFFYPEDPSGPISWSEASTALPDGWITFGGRWGIRHGMAIQSDTRPGEVSEARLRLPGSSLLLEITLQALSGEQRNPGAYGLLLLDQAGNETFTLEFVPRVGKGTATGMVTCGSGEMRREHPLPLPADFAPHAPHLVRLELDTDRLRLTVDGLPAWGGRLPSLPAAVALFSRNMAAGFSAFELTAGWEDNFRPGDHQGIESDPACLGWEALRGEGDWLLRDGLLWHVNPEGLRAQIVKGPLLAEYELVVNLRLGDTAGREGAYGIFPALGEGGELDPLISLEYLGSAEAGDEWGLAVRARSGRQVLPLPRDFDPTIFQQFRFTKRSGRLIVQWENQILDEMDIPAGPSRVGIYAHKAQVAVDLVRVTALPSVRESTRAS